LVSLETVTPAREKPKLTVRVNPQSSVYTGDTITLSCELQGTTAWEFEWYKNNKIQQGNSEKANTLIVTFYNAEETVYKCRAVYSSSYNHYTQYSDPVKITAKEKPTLTVRVNPQSSIYAEDTITLRCELQKTTGRKFFWYKNSKLVNTEVTNTLS
ncbi:Fc receptor-like protein 5, partial [Silurus meridionalis]